MFYTQTSDVVWVMAGGVQGIQRGVSGCWKRFFSRVWRRACVHALLAAPTRACEVESHRAYGRARVNPRVDRPDQLDIPYRRHPHDIPPLPPFRLEFERNVIQIFS